MSVQQIPAWPMSNYATGRGLRRPAGCPPHGRDHPHRGDLLRRRLVRDLGRYLRQLPQRLPVELPDREFMSTCQADYVRIPNAQGTLVPSHLTRAIDPGKVFDLTLPLEQVVEGYRDMDERRAIKALLKP
ncbi:hypothetical protein GCM10009735_79460 [Actinomadura chokoriensis]